MLDAPFPLLHLPGKLHPSFRLRPGPFCAPSFLGQYRPQQVQESRPWKNIASGKRAARNQTDMKQWLEGDVSRSECSLFEMFFLLSQNDPERFFWCGPTSPFMTIRVTAGNQSDGFFARLGSRNKLHHSFFSEPVLVGKSRR